MNGAIQKAIDALLESDPSVSPDQRTAAMAILDGHMPRKWPFPLRQGELERETNRRPTTAKPSKRYMRRVEAAQYMGCSVRQLDAMKADGNLPFCWLGRRLVIFRIEDLDDFMARQRVAVREKSLGRPL